MYPFKTQGLLEANPARLGRSDKAQIPYKEDARLIDRLCLDVLQLARKCVGNRVPKVYGQGSCADG